MYSVPLWPRMRSSRLKSHLTASPYNTPQPTLLHALSAFDRHRAATYPPHDQDVDSASGRGPAGDAARPSAARPECGPDLCCECGHDDAVLGEGTTERPSCPLLTLPAVGLCADYHILGLMPDGIVKPSSYCRLLSVQYDAERRGVRQVREGGVPAAHPQPGPVG